MNRPFPAYDGDAPYFFVSYAHDDAELVFPEMQWIHGEGFNLWYDDGIHVGTVWRRALAEALSRSAGLIFFSTETSAGSENCLKEINFALDQGKTIFVVQLDGTPMPLELQLSLNDRQALVRSDFEEQTYRQRLIAALAPLIKAQQPADATTATEDQPEKSAWRLVVGRITSPQGNDEIAMIAEDLTDDLRTILPVRYQDVKIENSELELSQGSFVLTGTARPRGPNVRITMKLVDVGNGQQFWTQTYDRPVENFYQLQDKLVNDITSALQDPMMVVLHEYFKNIADEDLDVFGLMSRVYRLRYSIVNRETRDRVLIMARRAVEIAPELAGAHTMLANVLHYVVTNIFTTKQQEFSEEAVRHIDKALALSPNNTVALWNGAMIHRCFGIESLGLKLAERCSSIMNMTHFAHYQCLLQLGRVDEMIRMATDDGAPYRQGLLSIAYLLQGKDQQALEHAQEDVSLAPQDFVAWAALANVLAVNGRTAEARQALAKVKEMVPTWTFDLQDKGTRLSWRNDERIVEVMTKGLRELDSGVFDD